MKDQSNLPTIAVLLAAFNGTPWIKEQIDSILNQQDINLTLFISVDQSNDGTESLVDQLAISDSRIKALPHGKYFGGAGANFYRLINDVDFNQYAYVALSDQDDLWNLDKLSNAIYSLEKNHAEGYSSNVIALWPDGRKRFLNRSQKQKDWDFLFEAAGPGCTYVFKKSLALDFQRFIKSNWNAVKEIQMHDWLLYAFSRANQRRWFIDKSASLMYRQHANNQFGANVGVSAFFTRVKKVLNGWGLTQSLAIAKVVGLGNHPFVLSWSRKNRIGYLRLSTHCLKCRRKAKDQLLFFSACVGLALFPPK